jgi:hypothetical protein
MDQRDSSCPYILLCEPTVKGPGLTKYVGKEDPFQLNSNRVSETALEV